jgi:hypothetical protein
LDGFKKKKCLRSTWQITLFHFPRLQKLLCVLMEKRVNWHEGGASAGMTGTGGNACKLIRAIAVRAPGWSAVIRIIPNVNSGDYIYHLTSNLSYYNREYFTRISPLLLKRRADQLFTAAFLKMGLSFHADWMLPAVQTLARWLKPCAAAALLAMEYFCVYRLFIDPNIGFSGFIGFR